MCEELSKQTAKSEWILPDFWVMFNLNDPFTETISGDRGCKIKIKSSFIVLHSVGQWGYSILMHYERLEQKFFAMLIIYLKREITLLPARWNDICYYIATPYSVLLIYISISTLISLHNFLSLSHPQIHTTLISLSIITLETANY